MVEPDRALEVPVAAGERARRPGRRTSKRSRNSGASSGRGALAALLRRGARHREDVAGDAVEERAVATLVALLHREAARRVGVPRGGAERAEVLGDAGLADAEAGDEALEAQADAGVQARPGGGVGLQVDVRLVPVRASREDEEVR